MTPLAYEDAGLKRSFHGLISKDSRATGPRNKARCIRAAVNSVNDGAVALGLGSQAITVG